MLCQQTIAFGLNVIVVGDLAQLPPVTGLQVFKSSISDMEIVLSYIFKATTKAKSG